MVWYSHLFQNFPQFIVIHTVKGFGVVNKAEIDHLDMVNSLGNTLVPIMAIIHLFSYLTNMQRALAHIYVIYDKVGAQSWAKSCGWSRVEDEVIKW